jgi:hypothetical protein
MANTTTIPYLPVAGPYYIDREDCLGDSLKYINDNTNYFASITNKAVSLYNNIRLSLTTDPVPSGGFNDITSTNLYVHPYNGNAISLYDNASQSWRVYTLNSILTFPLVGLAANSNYDIYLYNNSGTIAAEFVPWSSHAITATQPQPPNRDLTYGAATKVGDPTRKYVGCLRTTDVNTSVIRFGYNGLRLGSNPSFYLWNYYNRVKLNYNLKFIKNPGTPEGLGYWKSDASYRTIPTAAIDDRAYTMREFGGSASTIATGAKLSFITGDQTDAFMSASMWTNTTVPYYIYGVNVNETTYKKTIGDLIAQSPFSGMYEGGAGSISSRYPDGDGTAVILTNTIAGGFKGQCNIMPLLAEYTNGGGCNFILYAGTIDYRHTFLWSGYVEC